MPRHAAHCCGDIAVYGTYAWWPAAPPDGDPAFAGGMPRSPSGRYTHNLPVASDQVAGLFPEYTYALNCAGLPASSSGSTLRNVPVPGS
ncbi:MAG: hypothetical protein QM611_05310 [Microbacterium sp.]|uniref:hypothetical protein n=1 Tax=Microbacterium sp. TaxID=51671 RepID=UPI0039E41758